MRSQGAAQALAECRGGEAHLDAWLEETRSLNASLRRRLRDGSFQFVGV
jgi:hypothetical protein